MHKKIQFLKYKNGLFYVDNSSVDKLSRKFKTPFYCYSLSQIKLNLNNFKNCFNKIKPLICFSVKSNSNLEILKNLKREGCGADVVSIGELKIALKAGINPKKIVFSGVGKTEEELIFAIKKKILLINIESESEAKLINKISKKNSVTTSVGIRLNPNISSGTNKKISTGSSEDKFGLTENSFLRLIKEFQNFKNLSLQGLSIHIGSQILRIEPFEKTLKILERVIKKSKIKFKYVDLGGGIGISYENKIKNFDLKKYNNLVEKFVAKKRCKVIFEPGRLIIGNAGILVTKIIYIKNTNKKKFIILDSGMNDLIRPALYDSKHLILPIKKNKKIIKKNIQFVGPCCESSDKFLTVKKYQKIKEKDFLLISDVGSYGMSLASNYCFRPRAAEILVNKSSIKLIRRRENLDKLI